MMYQVFNTITNTPEAVLSETPYELAGPLAERKQEQKRDEQGNLLYLTTTEVVDTAQYYDADGNYIPATDPDEVLRTKTIEIETTEATWSETIAETWDENGNVLTTRVEVHQNPPVMVDAGPVYEWRGVIQTPEQIAAETQASLVAAVQSHLDAAARQYGYDDIKSAVTYAEEPAVPKFQAEGQAFRAWRSHVWAACYAILNDVLDNKRDVPTVDELLAELPALEVQGG